jgi:hypothetical protein
MHNYKIIKIMAYSIFWKIETLLEYTPIELDTYRIGKLAPNTFTGSKYIFKDIDRIATRLGVLEVGRD